MNDRFKYRYYYEGSMCNVVFADFVNPYVNILCNGEIIYLGREETKLENLMQCTGLKDKNGKLIYERDIIKTTPSGYFDKGTDIFYVKYCCTGFFLATPYRHMEGDWECSDTIGTYDSNLYECIGNIYMNPELLEAKDEHT